MRNLLPIIALSGAAAAAITIGPRSARADETVIITPPHHHIRMQDNEIRVTVNGNPVEFEGPGPILIDGSHVFVPIRGVFEQIGGNVDWHPDAQVVEGSTPGHMFRIRIGSENAIVNGEQEILNTPPQLIDGTTYVPLRFTSEALGAYVEWHPDTNTVTIHSHDSGATGSSAPEVRYEPTES